jgi:hypothetical protein
VGHRQPSIMRVVVMAVASLTIGCTATKDRMASQELQMNKAKWEAANVRDYGFTLHWSSVVTSPERIGPNRITVRNGKVIVATHVGEGGPYEDGDEVTTKLENPATVEALFSFVSRELRGRDMWPVHVVYHETLGYPKSITLGDPNVMDGADFIEITELVPE